MKSLHEISVRITADTKNAIEQTKKFRSAVEKELKDVQVGIGTEKGEKQIKTFKSHLAELRAAVKQFSQQAKIDAGLLRPTREFQEVKKEISKAEAELEKLNQKKREFGKNTTAPTKEFKETQKAIQDVEKELDKLRNKQASTNFYTNKETDAYSQIKKNIRDAEKALSAAQTSQKKLIQSPSDMRGSDHANYAHAQVEAQMARERLAEVAKMQGALERGAKAKGYTLEGANPTAPEQVIRSWERMQNEIIQCDERAEKFEQTMNDIERGKVGANSQRWHELQAEIDTTTEKLERYRAEERRMQSMGQAYQTNEKWRENAREIAAAGERLVEYRAKEQEMLNDGSAFKPTEAWQRNQEAIEGATQKLAAYKAMQDSLHTSGRGYEAAGPQSNIKTLGAYAGAGAGKLGGKIFNALPDSFKDAAAQMQKFSGRVGGVSSKVGTFFRGMKNDGAAAVGWLKNLSNGFGKVFAKIPLLNRFSRGLGGLNRQGGQFKKALLTGMGLKAFARFAAGGMILYGSTMLMKQGLKDLAQYSVQTNADISGLWGALITLRNALATAFAPILSVVAPILVKFMNMLTQAATFVAHFFSALTGKSKVVVAKNVTKDYAKSLQGSTSGSGGNAASVAAKNAKAQEAYNKKLAAYNKRMAAIEKSTKDANKATKEYQKTLMGFDQINKLDEKDKDSSAGSAKTPTAPTAPSSPTLAGATPSAGALNPALDMFKTVDVSKKAKDWAKRFRDAWKNADFSGIGAALARKLNDQLRKIDWNKIRNTSKKIASSIATFINGFVRAADWRLIGYTLGQGINTILDFAETFTRKLDWRAIGTALGTGLESTVRTIEWDLIFKTLSNGLKGILSAIAGFFESINWREFGEGIINTIVKCVKALDGKGIVKALYEALGAAVGACAGLAVGLAKGIIKLIVKGIKAAVDYFRSNIKDCGGNVILGVLNGIWTAIKAIDKWIVQNIFKPFITGFLKAFGISGKKSGKMNEHGKSLGESILDGLKKAVPALLKFIAELPGQLAQAAGVIMLSVGLKLLEGIKSVWDWMQKNHLGRKILTFNIGLALLKGIVSVWKWLHSKKLGKKVLYYSIALVRKFAGGAKTVAEWLKKKVWGDKQQDQKIGAKKNFKGGSKSVAEWIKRKENWGNTPSKPISLVKQFLSGAGSVAAWLLLGRNWGKTPKKGVSLKKEFPYGLGSVARWLVEMCWGGTPKKGVGLMRDWGFRTVTGWVLQYLGSGSINIGVNLVKQGAKAAWNLVTGLSGGGVFIGGSWRPITAAASGGAFSTGQMFVAREAGPELVGTIGGHTAVMNNDQIVASVSDGVYKAVLSAMSQFQNNGGSQTTEVVIQVGEEKLAKAVQRGQNKLNRRYSPTK